MQPPGCGLLEMLQQKMYLTNYIIRWTINLQEPLPLCPFLTGVRLTAWINKQLPYNNNSLQLLSSMKLGPYRGIWEIKDVWIKLSYAFDSHLNCAHFYNVGFNYNKQITKHNLKCSYPRRVDITSPCFLSEKRVMTLIIGDLA